MLCGLGLFTRQLFNRGSQALECFILMLHCLKQSGEQDANIVFVNVRNPSGNLAARDNPTSIEYRASRRC
jgi:hypothetical protein